MNQNLSFKLFAFRMLQSLRNRNVRCCFILTFAHRVSNIMVRQQNIRCTSESYSDRHKIVNTNYWVIRFLHASDENSCFSKFLNMHYNVCICNFCNSVWWCSKDLLFFFFTMHVSKAVYVMYSSSLLASDTVGLCVTDWFI